MSSSRSPSPSPSPSPAASIRSRVLTNPWLIVFVLAGLVTAIVPFVHWHKQRSLYYKYQGIYNEYEQQQQQQEEQNNNNNNYENNENNNYYYSPCKWYEFSCKRRYKRYARYNNNNNANENNIMLPEWYYTWGGLTEEQRRGEGEGAEGNNNFSNNDAPLTFIYTWTLFLFFTTVLGLGAFFLYTHNGLLTTSAYFSPLIMTMFLVAQWCWLLMTLLVRGVIQTEERMFERSLYGWYGQTSVLLFLSSRAIYTFCWIGLVGLILRAIYVRRQQHKGQQQDQQQKDVEMQPYHVAPGQSAATAQTQKSVSVYLDQADQFLQRNGL